MCYIEESKQSAVLSIAASVKIIGSTAGTLLGGFIPSVLRPDLYRQDEYTGALLVAAVVYFLAVLPLFGIENIQKDIVSNDDNTNANSPQSEK